MTQGHNHNFGSDGYVHCPACGAGFMSVCICQNYQILYFKYIEFIAEITLNRAVKKK